MFFRICTYFVFIFLFVDSAISYWSTVLDTTEDIFRSWTLTGNYLYIPKGDHLDLIANKLPSNFNFKAFQSSLGIWTILPDENFVTYSAQYNETNKLWNTASFSFQSSSQLLSSVSVKHNIRGKGAKIYIRAAENQKPLYEIEAAEETPSNDWVEVNVPLELSSRFFVEAEVNETGDYVFIDRIEAFYLETTTSTKRPKTTTSPPAPFVSSSPNIFSTSLNYLTFVLAIYVSLIKFY